MNFEEREPVKDLNGGPKEIKIESLNQNYEQFIKRIDDLFKNN